MKDRQASAHQHSYDGRPESEREPGAGNADFEARETVEEWLHDAIARQNARMHAGLDDEMAERDETKDSILSDLARRVRALAESRDSGSDPGDADNPVNSGGVAQTAGRNYDEDARVLIEGIKARAQARVLSGDAANVQIAPQSGEDKAADRLMNMLKTIEFLERRLRTASNPSSETNPAPGGQETMDDPDNIARFTRLERQLQRLEAYVNEADGYEGGLTERESAAGIEEFSRENRRKATQSRGRRALQHAIETISSREGGDEDADLAYIPRNRPMRLSSRRQDSDRQFVALTQKIEALQNGTPDVAAIDALKAEFAALRRDITENGGGANAKAEIARLRETILAMQKNMTDALEDGRLATVETDVNRIAEFLLKSPDLSKLPDQTAFIAREIGRISDSLLALGDKAAVAAYDNGERVVGQIEERLQTLRNDIVAQLRDNTTGTTVVSTISSDLEYRLSGLRAHIDGLTSTLSGQVSRIEDRMATAVTALDAFHGAEKSAYPSARQLEEMEDRLKDAVGALTRRFEEMGTQNSAGLKAGGEALARQMEDRLRIMHDEIVYHLKDGTGGEAMTSAVVNGLEQRLSGLREHIDGAVRTISGQMAGTEEKMISAAKKIEKLGHSRNDASDFSGKMEKMEARLVEAARRLEQASIGAARAAGDAPAALLSMPADMMTSDELKEEFGKLASRLDESIARLKPDDTAGALTAERLRLELEGLGAQLTKTIQSNRNEKANPSAGAITNDELKKELAYLAGELRESFAAERSHMVNHIDSAIATLQALADAQRGSMSQIVRESTEHAFGMMMGGKAAASSSDERIAGIRDGIDGLKQSAVDLSAQTKSSFETVRGLLEGVSARLDTLEKASSAGQENHGGEKDEEEIRPDEDAMDLSSAARLGTVTQGPDPAVAALTAHGENPDEEIMRRMREHVKAGYAEATFLSPGADDMPLAPGAGKPDLKMPPAGEPGSQAAQPKPARDRRPPEKTMASGGVSAPDDYRDKAPQKTKADFIAAARRAAQAAASEQSAMEFEEEEAAARSSLSSIRERISSVARMGRNKRRTQNKSEDASSDGGLADSRHQPVLSGMDGADAPHSEESSFVDDFAAGIAQEESGNGSRVKFLTASLAVALVGTGYIFLKEPIRTLVTDLTEPALLTNSVPQPAAVKPPSTDAIPVPVPARAPGPAGSAGLPGPESAPDSIASSGSATAGSGLLTGSVPGAGLLVPPSALPARTGGIGGNGDLALLKPPVVSDQDAALGIDTSVTQSIALATSIAGEPETNTVIAEAVRELPSGSLSARLADALAKNDPSAFIELARRFGQGDIFERDLQKAAFWYHQAAEKENAVAQYRLGTLYEEGIGVAKNPRIAREWYIRAAENGNARAMHNLAVLYTEGVFGEPDFKEAFKWFERGASYGIKDSQFNLGILYVRGLGVKASLPQAYKWFDIVAKSGDIDAGEKRDEVEKALNPEQLKNIKAEIAQWKKKDWAIEANVIAPPPGYWRDGAETGVAVLSQKQGDTLYSSSLVKEAQVLLNGLGFNLGEPDGVAGNRTKEAVRSFEYEIGLPQTGKITKKLVEILKAQKS